MKPGDTTVRGRRRQGVRRPAALCADTLRSLGLPTLLLATAALAAPPSWATGSGGSPSVLYEGDRGFLRSGAPIAVDPGDVPLDAAYVLLDGIEVTEWIEPRSGHWVLALPTPPEEGVHRLELFEEAPDALLQRGAWNVEIRESSFLRGLEGTAEASLGAYHRVRDHDLESGSPDRTFGRGAALYEGRVDAGRGGAELYAPLLFDSEGGRSGLGRRFDPADYLARGWYGPASFEIGHHTPAPGSLVLEGFHRRGLSTHVEAPLGLRFSSFVMRTDPFTGLRESFGLTDEDRRVVGGAIAIDPVSLGIGELELAATYLDGTGDESGTAVGTARTGDITERSQAYGLVADARFWDRRIRVRGEYARSRFDFDGGGGAGDERDDAYAWLVSLRPLRDATLLGQPIETTLSAEEREIGTFFRSLANPGAPVDLKTRTWRWSFSWGGLFVDASWSRSRDNRDDEDDQVTYRTGDAAVDLTWTPHWLPDADRGDWTRWLGTPTVRAGWSRIRRKPLAHEDRVSRFFDPFSGTIVEVEAPDPLNQTTRTWYVELGSTWRRWGWSASHTEIRFDDARDLAPDSTTDLTDVDVFVTPHDRVRLDARFQKQVVREREPDFETTRYLAGAGLDVEAIPDRLDVRVHVDWTQARDSIRARDERSMIVTGAWSWHAVRPTGRLPGLTLSLLGTWRDRDDAADSAFDRDAYQVFLRAEVRWSMRH